MLPSIVTDTGQVYGTCSKITYHEVKSNTTKIRYYFKVVNLKIIFQKCYTYSEGVI